MWVFLSRRLRRWAVLAALFPAARAAAGGVAGRLERRSGSTTLTRTLRRASKPLRG